MGYKKEILDLLSDCRQVGSIGYVLDQRSEIEGCRFDSRPDHFGLFLGLDNQTQVDSKPAGQPEHAKLNQCQLIAAN